MYSSPSSAGSLDQPISTDPTDTATSWDFLTEEMERSLTLPEQLYLQARIRRNREDAGLGGYVPGQTSTHRPHKGEIWVPPPHEAASSAAPQPGGRDATTYASKSRRGGHPPVASREEASSAREEAGSEAVVRRRRPRRTAAGLEGRGPSQWPPSEKVRARIAADRPQDRTQTLRKT